MYTLGQIVKPSDIGLKYYQKLIFAECSCCGHQRFVRKDKLISDFKTKFCGKCNHNGNKNQHRNMPTGEAHYAWRGKEGNTTDNGYILVRLNPDDFFYPMTQRGKILEHRLVMAQSLGRCLHTWEIVHHKGVRFKGIKNRSDNLRDNLQLVSDDRHKQITLLEKKITFLEAENQRLKALLNTPRGARQ